MFSPGPKGPNHTTNRLDTNRYTVLNKMGSGQEPVHN